MTQADLPHSRRPPRRPRPAPAPRCASPAIARLIARLDDARNAPGADAGSDAIAAIAARVEAFWRGEGAVSPLLETGEAGEAIFTFLWRSESAESILLLVNRLSDGADISRSELERVPGTDVWHLSYALESSWRGSYGYLVHDGPGPAPWAAGVDAEPPTLRELFERARVDPRGALLCPSRSGRLLSVAEGTDAPPQPWRRDPSPEVSPPAALRPTVGPDGRRCWLFGDPRDATRRPDTEPRALWLILDGEVWAEHFDLGAMLSAMIRDRAIPPLCAVLIDSGGLTERWSALAGDSGLVDALADRYVPWAREQFGEGFGAPLCGVAGQSLGGHVAVRCGIERPDVFGRTLAQSASLWLGLPALDRIAAAPAERTDARRFHLEVGTHEWVLLEPNRELHERLTAIGFDSSLTEYAGGHDYACWRGGLLDGIVAFG